MKESMTVTELSEQEAGAFRDAMAPIYDKYETVWTPELADAVKPE